MTILLNELRELGLANVDYPQDLRATVQNAVTSWKAFCNLPKEEKNAFAFLEDTHGDGAGYELKEEKGSKKDLKENFHVSLFQYERLTQIANQRTFPFLHDAKALLDGIEPIVVEFARQVEEEYGVPGLTAEVQRSKQYWILRYLHYFGDQNPNVEIAAPHGDKGGFTLHLYESDDGLQYLSIDSRMWKPMPVDEKQTVIIPAMQLQQRSGGNLKALYHRVLANEHTAKHGRFSMVCFIIFDDSPKYNKEAFGNMQSHDVGFNYDMPKESFNQLFK